MTEAAERQRRTTTRLQILAGDPTALNTYEQQVLRTLLPVASADALPFDEFMRAAGYKIKRCFGEMVDRLERAGLLECNGLQGFTLTEAGRGAVCATRATHLAPRSRAWLTPAEHDILALLASESGEGLLPLVNVRESLHLRSDLTYGSIEQLVVAGYVGRERSAVRITEAGRQALPRLGRITEADELDVSAYADRFSPAYLKLHGSRIHLRTLPLPFRRTVRAYLLDELEQGRPPHGIQKSLKALRLFLHFFVSRHPDAVDFTALQMADVDAFIDARSRDRAGIPRQRLARVAKGDLARALQFLDFLRQQHDPQVAEDFTTVPFRHRARIASGAVQLRAQRALRAVPNADELLTAEERTQLELAKDCWQIAHLAGVHRHPTSGITRLDFTEVPAAFRSAVKDYFRVILLVTGRSDSHAHAELRRLRAFVQFYAARHPDLTTLADLGVADVDAWVAHLRTTPNGRGRPRSDVDVVDGTLIAQHFARFLQRMGRPEAPTRPFDRIFVPERLPRCGRRFAHGGVKYIPVSVLGQIDARVDRFEEQYLPVVLVLRASGWRISDVLNLRWDRCLEGDDAGCWLVGDIHKTRVLGHKVPITSSIAAVIEVQIRLVRQAFTEAENPEHFLFPSPHPARLGLPVSPNVIRAAFQRFVKRCEIVDPSGQPFRLRAHAFRHTKAVELINNGMGMTYVQQWLAHLTPEMTLIYAQLSEDTMRKQWEQAMAQGAVQVRAEGPQIINPEELIAGNELELAYIRGNLDATRVETGYCFKPLKMECPFVDIACFTCHNHVTTADFLPQFRRQEQDLLNQVELGAAAGRPHWVDKNQKKLRAVQAVISALEQQKVHGLPKAQREYGRSERAERAARGAG